MTRFIISPDQAVELIFKALKYGVGGDVFVPKLPAFRIVDLIEILKEKHKADNKVKLIGIRPGEKIHELMINSVEVPRSFSFKDLYVITSSIEDNKNKDIEYINNGKQLEEDEIYEYSSKGAVVSKEEVKKLFKELELL